MNIICLNNCRWCNPQLFISLYLSYEWDPIFVTWWIYIVNKCVAFFKVMGHPWINGKNLFKASSASHICQCDCKVAWNNLPTTNQHPTPSEYIYIYIYSDEMLLCRNISFLIIHQADHHHRPQTYNRTLKAHVCSPTTYPININGYVHFIFNLQQAKLLQQHRRYIVLYMLVDHRLRRWWDVWWVDGFGWCWWNICCAVLVACSIHYILSSADI